MWISWLAVGALSVFCLDQYGKKEWKYFWCDFAFLILNLLIAIPKTVW